MKTSLDLQGQDAAWWAEQARRYKAETAKLQRQVDEQVQEHQKELDAVRKDEQEAQARAMKEQVEKLRKQYEQELHKLLVTPPGVAALHKEHQAELLEVSQRHARAREELIKKLREEGPA